MFVVFTSRKMIGLGNSAEMITALLLIVSEKTPHLRTVLANAPAFNRICAISPGEKQRKRAHIRKRLGI